MLEIAWLPAEGLRLLLVVALDRSPLIKNPTLETVVVGPKFENCSATTLAEQLAHNTDKVVNQETSYSQ